MSVGAIVLYGVGVVLLVGYARRGDGTFDRSHWSGLVPTAVVLAAAGLLVAGSALVARAVVAHAPSMTLFVAVVLGVVHAAVTVRKLWDVLFLAVFR